MDNSTRCMGLTITGKLQVNCPVRLTCLNFIKSGKAKQPEHKIYASGCREYDRISAADFRNKKSPLTTN